MPISMIEKNLDNMNRKETFTKLDMFRGYLKIRLAENVKEKTESSKDMMTFKFELMPLG